MTADQLPPEFGWAPVDLVDVMPEFTAGLIAAAARLLAVVMYRDAITVGPRRFRRRAATKSMALALLPADCDGQDQQFRLAVAHAFEDLAHDIDAGHLPQPRCTAEIQALQIMLAQAPELLSASDEQLRQLGITVASSTDEHEYEQPYWEQVWNDLFTEENLEYTIAEAQPARDSDGEHAAGDWAGVRYWFSAFTVFAPRSPRPHPLWVSAALEHGLTTEDSDRAAHAAHLLHLGAPNPWSAHCSEDFGPGCALGEVLTNDGAAVLVAAARELAEIGYHEIIEYGDEPFNREDYEQTGWAESVLGLLPSICDHQNAAWRLAMIRAIGDLAEDMEAGRAPLPRCNAEEIALHLILAHAEEIFDRIDDDDEYAQDWQLPHSGALTGRHRRLSMMREIFFQDDDVLMHYDGDLAEVAADPDELAMQYLKVGDIRPPSWWWTFGNLTPRPAGRGFNARVVSLLKQRYPFPAAEQHDQPEDAALGHGLAQEFETYVGLAQRRFFDPACAVAMARSFTTLMTVYLDTPQFNIHMGWAVGERANADGEILLFDRDFVLEGLTQRWRLRSDMTDAQARVWARNMLADCSSRVVQLYATAAPELRLFLSNSAVPQVDPDILDRLGATSRDLSLATTLGRFFAHRRMQLELAISDVADAALLPSSIIAGWEAGASATPSQLIRCAPVLQLEENVLLQAEQGHRTAGYWPLPQPKPTHLER